MALKLTLVKQIALYRPWMNPWLDPDLEIPSRIQVPSLKPLQPLNVDSWTSLHVNMTDRK